ncbi:GNAT family N-acetyltransferase [Antrihabitans sp. YC2-6]|uniref:GNAT family N-acetyltransferase n=1 Tax=Antrihabitans sp. YC2-6 TaxID=2799498 RepID=UPI0035A85FAD
MAKNIRPPITIRTARPDEYDAVAEVIVDVYVGDGFIPAGSDYASILAQTAARAAHADILVAEIDGEVVGTITIAAPGSRYAPLALPDELEFRMLAVAKTARGSGIGTALVRRVLETAADGGYRAVVISTMPDMVDARRIYDEIGFVHVPERDWVPEPGVQLTVMACSV